MKVFVITLFAAAFLSVEASPKPGGYTLKGGVDSRYVFKKPPGYYDAAQSAGKIKHKALTQIKSNLLGINRVFFISEVIICMLL